ncbi:hypothetical protein FB451DRAFT_1413365 [Mycena latifolia]|nr:hypothetical protein FB451DRAFT_1413365 [Mycena latifolia]
MSLLLPPSTQDHCRRALPRHLITVRLVPRMTQIRPEPHINPLLLSPAIILPRHLITERRPATGLHPGTLPLSRRLHSLTMFCLLNVPPSLHLKLKLKLKLHLLMLSLIVPIYMAYLIAVNGLLPIHPVPLHRSSEILLYIPLACPQALLRIFLRANCLLLRLFHLLLN